MLRVFNYSLIKFYGKDTLNGNKWHSSGQAEERKVYHRLLCLSESTRDEEEKLLFLLYSNCRIFHVMATNEANYPHNDFLA